jgi:hypothetical protein
MIAFMKNFKLNVLQSPGKFFKIKFFVSLPGEVFLIKKKKKSFYEKFAGRQQYERLIGSYVDNKHEDREREEVDDRLE